MTGPATHVQSDYAEPGEEGPERHTERSRERAGGSLNRLAVSATVHCLTGCAAGEVTGMAIAIALG
jgi:hypothetical protein